MVMKTKRQQVNRLEVDPRSHVLAGHYTAVRKVIIPSFCHMESSLEIFVHSMPRSHLQLRRGPTSRRPMAKVYLLSWFEPIHDTSLLNIAKREDHSAITASTLSGDCIKIIIKSKNVSRGGYNRYNWVDELTLQWRGQCDIPWKLVGVWRPHSNIEAQLLQSNKSREWLQCYLMRGWHVAAFFSINSCLLQFRLSLLLKWRKVARIGLRWYTSPTLFSKWHRNSQLWKCCCCLHVDLQYFRYLDITATD